MTPPSPDDPCFDDGHLQCEGGLTVEMIMDSTVSELSAHGMANFNYLSRGGNGSGFGTGYDYGYNNEACRIHPNVCFYGIFGKKGEYVGCPDTIHATTYSDEGYQIVWVLQRNIVRSRMNIPFGKYSGTMTSQGHTGPADVQVMCSNGWIMGEGFFRM